MLRNLKISTKLFSGFGLMLALLLFIGTAGVAGMLLAKNDFSEYRTLARGTNIAGRLETDMLLTRLNVKNFIINQNEVNIAGVKERAQTTLSLIPDALILAASEEEKQTISAIEILIWNYIDYFDLVVEKQRERNIIVNDHLNILGPRMEKNLITIMESAHQEGNNESAYLAGRAIRSFLLGRLYATKFLVDNSNESYERAIAELKKFEIDKRTLLNSIKNPNQRYLAIENQNLLRNYAENLNLVYNIINERNNIITDDLDVIGPEIAVGLENLKINSLLMQNELGPKVERDTATALTIIVTISGIALLFGGVATYFIGTGISYPVIAMTNAMKVLASGDSSIAIPGQDHKDEIGSMAKAVQVFKDSELNKQSLERAKSIAEELAKAKSDFLATMSHEIRTPMNGVMTMANILDQTQLTSDQREMTKTIRQSSEALLIIINDILDFSKIEAGKLAIESVRFDLLEQIESAADLIAPRAEAASLLLLVDLDDMIPETVIGDPTRLRQILLNLAGNAVKFTTSGSVTIRLRHVPSDEGSYRMRFEVIDTGIGMTKEQVGGLFQAFAQADSSTARKFGGTGLGLAISKQLVELMGGDIGVISEPGVGSTFWFELPLNPVRDAFIDCPYELDDARVLLAGYDPREADTLVRMLRLGGVQHIVALPRPDALAGLAEGSKFDLLILDGRPGTPTVVEWGRIIPRHLGLDHPNCVITAPHMALSALQLDGSVFPEDNFLGTIRVPVHTRRLWDFVAVGVGQLSADKLVTVSDAVRTFTAPSPDIAREHNAIVLVAEDNPTNQMVIKRVLDRMGVAHEMANNGQEALEFLAERSFDLLLSDFHMPIMDGLELTKALRAQEAATGAARLPVVALTADVLPETAKRCEEAGMDGYLRKPIEIDRLEDILRTYVPSVFEIRSVAQVSSPEAPAKPAAAAAAVAEAKVEPAGEQTPRAALQGVDPDIFDPDALNDAFGDFDRDAADFVLGFVDTVKPQIEAINQAFETQDYSEARHIAHAMKGASLSTGAMRLGRLMKDIQDSLDDEDPDTADIYREGLLETYDELQAALAPLR